MLSRCRAFVIAQTEPQNRSLINLAERVGFSAVGSPFGDPDMPVEAARGEVVFFLVHHMLNDSIKGAILRRIRGSDDVAFRYAPVVLVSGAIAPEVVRDYVELGFDDIVTLPKKRETLIARLSAQLDTDHTYFETLDYVGPDRRRLEVPGLRQDERRKGDAPFTRVTINRSVERGVRVVRRELVGRQIREPEYRPRFLPTGQTTAAMLAGS